MSVEFETRRLLVGEWLVEPALDQMSHTDEYDDHVIIHEWGYCFEDKFSRSDSIGGNHSNELAFPCRCDPRLDATLRGFSSYRCACSGAGIAADP
jgi:hypothetical protein